ncbi:hypothetical protein EW146_g6742 [Bondarzewia mesenterica]|uniref:Protein kinase domain-containing protein n=1 Tax=Bondarzewia mesenterica TaxID=1095465 RepID=A0A4S4LND9_9AGAM|nr:hypothetical protein EW146_g6742 [Bondarzewia mesenterica]
MASTSTKQNSRFSSFKVFKFAGPKPPPPPPKDTNYLYSATNPSVLSFSNQSLSADSFSQPPTPHSTQYRSQYARSPSPAPSRATQSAASSNTLSPSDSAGFRKGFMKVASLGKRTFTPKSPRSAPIEDMQPPEPRDDESISLPWNFQHHVHVDEALGGIPPSWSTSLAGAGFTEEEIVAIQQARRARSPSALIPLSRTQSPAPSLVLANPRPRSSSLRRQKSDASLARSERSHRLAERAPPLPQASSQAPRKFSNASTHADASVERSYSEIDATESVAAHSDAQYVYVSRVSPATLAPVQSPATLRSGGSASSPSVMSTSSTQLQQSIPTRPQPARSRTPPRRVFRIVNETSPAQRSPPPAYKSPSKDNFHQHEGSVDELLELPPPVTVSDARRPAPVEKLGLGNGEGSSGRAGHEEDEDEEDERDRDELDESSLALSRPSPRLSVLPPRLSLRQDAIDDLSSWTESLFSSIPSGLTSDSLSLTSLSDTPTSGVSLSTPFSGGTSKKSSPDRKLPPKSIPNILLSSSSATYGDEGPEENSFHLTASPLYNELMGMMQDRPPLGSSSSGQFAPSLASPALAESPMIPGSPASPSFQTHLEADGRGRSSARDSSNSQLTIEPPRCRARDSDMSVASGSTVTHATIVHGASLVRSATANMVLNPAKRYGKHRGQEEDEIEEIMRAPPISPVFADASRPLDSRPSSRSSRSSSDSGSASRYGFSGSPRQTLSMTSGSNSQEDGGLKSPGLVYLHSPLSSPSAMKTQFETDIGSADRAAQPSIVVTADVIDNGSSSGSIKGALTAASAVSPSSHLSSPSTPSQRYPDWLSEVIKPLAEFIKDVVDPRDLFADLQEIAEGESGSVYCARVIGSAPVPPLATKKIGARKSQLTSPTFPYADASELIAIKSVLILPSGSPKLSDLRRELELMRGIRHPNVLKMEALYVDLMEDSLWICMELMERSLADVLGVEVDEEDEAIIIGERMVARFVWDVLLALSYLQKQHIAHRDLRSDNLLVNKNGVLKLADFSNATYSPPGTPKSSDNVGVIYWQAPEMRM